MSLTVWLSLLAACAVISLTPGAGAINTMTNALTQGWRRSLWGILGQNIALIVHIVIVAAGVGLLVARSPILFSAIRYAGAAYLVYLGVRLILIRTDAPDDEGRPPGAPESAWSMLRRGFWVNMLNPKAIVFYLAFMPQFISLDQPQLPQYAIFLATSLGVDTAIMWGFFAAAARPFRSATRTPRGRKTLNSVFGALFIVVAALLVLVH
ncbi:LysE family transporter [Leucobacter soli]|uniref:Homoserine/homoserine lactone efflux protein n=1 Tax=Leucobacter soli TaxID=2812850 RepID=A0A916JY67_9MICO|nr:LysE family transporter [Leucobacter soli]CAG7615050.1 Homoserine/homoserine lactone efflux protein [Leucobacter soli]